MVGGSRDDSGDIKADAGLGDDESRGGVSLESKERSSPGLANRRQGRKARPMGRRKARTEAKVDMDADGSMAAMPGVASVAASVTGSVAASESVAAARLPAANASLRGGRRPRGPRGVDVAGSASAAAAVSSSTAVVNQASAIDVKAEESFGGVGDADVDADANEQQGGGGGGMLRTQMQAYSRSSPGNNANRRGGRRPRGVGGEKDDDEIGI